MAVAIVALVGNVVVEENVILELKGLRESQITLIKNKISDLLQKLPSQSNSMNLFIYYFKFSLVPVRSNPKKVAPVKSKVDSKIRGIFLLIIYI